MKIRDDLILRKVGDTWAVFPVGNALIHYGNIMKLNETGVFMWNMLVQGCSQEELTTAAVREYEVEKTRASEAAMQFLTSLRENGILCDSIL